MLQFVLDLKGVLMLTHHYMWSCPHSEVTGTSFSQAAGVQNNSQSSVITNQILSSLMNKGGKEELPSPNPLVSTRGRSTNIAQNKKQKRLVNEYIDLAEMSPARGKSEHYQEGWRAIGSRLFRVHAIDIEFQITREARGGEVRMGDTLG